MRCLWVALTLFLPETTVQRLAFGVEKKLLVQKQNKMKKPIILRCFYQLVFYMNVRERRESPQTLSVASFISERCIFDTSINQWVPIICILCYKKLPFFLIFLFCSSQEINSYHFHLKSCGVWLRLHLQARFHDSKLSLIAVLGRSTLRANNLDCQALSSLEWHVTNGLAQVCRSVCWVLQNSQLWWVMLAIWFLTFSQCYILLGKEHLSKCV